MFLSFFALWFQLFIGFSFSFCTLSNRLCLLFFVFWVHPMNIACKISFVWVLMLYNSIVRRVLHCFTLNFSLHNPQDIFADKRDNCTPVAGVYYDGHWDTHDELQYTWNSFHKGEKKKSKKSATIWIFTKLPFCFGLFSGQVAENGRYKLKKFEINLLY